MTDTEILQFIFNRMVDVHKENPNYDYMIKFKLIIMDMSLDDEFHKNPVCRAPNVTYCKVAIGKQENCDGCKWFKKLSPMG